MQIPSELEMSRIFVSPDAARSVEGTRLGTGFFVSEPVARLGFTGILSLVTSRHASNHRTPQSL